MVVQVDIPALPWCWSDPDGRGGGWSTTNSALGASSHWHAKGTRQAACSHSSQAAFSGFDWLPRVMVQASKGAINNLTRWASLGSDVLYKMGWYMLTLNQSSDLLPWVSFAGQWLSRWHHITFG